MSFEHIIQTYGYWALFVGTFLEGEMILVIGGFLCHRGYLDLPLVIFAAFAGSLAGDQLYFFLGRTKGNRFLSKRPSWEPNIAYARALLKRHMIPLAIGFRFIYGIRPVTPFVFGMSAIKTMTFLFLNALGALLWSVAIASLGYLFGSAMKIFIGNVERYEREALVAIVIVGVAIWTVHRFIRKRKIKRSKKPGDSTK